MNQPKALSHELSARYLTPLLAFALERIGRVPLEAFVSSWDVSLAELEDETNWVSLAFCEALVEWMATKAPVTELEQEVTRRIFEPKSMGFIYPVLRAVGSPRQIYASIPRLAGVLNKVSKVTVRKVQRSRAVIAYGPAQPELVERSPLICRLRRAQLIAGPTVFGLPPAALREVTCQAQGAPECLYELSWTNRAGWWATVVGLALGVTLGMMFGAGPWTFSSALAGALAGRLLDGRRQLRELMRFNEEQAQGLQEAATASEHKFVEVLEAKAEVDKKVEQRTSELHSANDKLAESLQRLEALSHVKDEFLANVSHELRTPLTLILAPLEHLLSDEEVPPSVRDYLRAMHRATVRLHGMVNDLLELARIEAGHLRLAIAETDANELARLVSDQFRPLARQREITLVVEPDTAPAPVWIDAGRMEFVLNNLLSNAMKFTRPSGSVTMRVAGSSDVVRISVVDTGAGISPEHQQRIFERFARYDNPLAPGAAGAGIGLALVKGIVELHGGAVSLSSEVGKGTTLTVELRKGRDHLREDIIDRRRADVPVPFGRRTDDGGISGAVQMVDADRDWLERPQAPADAPTVLVVEDNDDLRAFLVRVLSRRFNVVDAPDGERGLARAHADRPDAIISDVMMPGIDGYELVRRLKGDVNTRAIPVLLITARKGAERVLEGFDSGADDYLVKPFNPRELLARVDVHVRLRKLMVERVHDEKLILMGTLAAGLAHEVNNPAGAILAGLPRLRKDLEGQAPMRALRLVDTCIECAQRITNLVGDLLMLGQPDREGPRLWDPHEGLRAALRVLEHRAPAGVKVRCDFGFHGEVRARPAAINQVFLNLLDNAFKAVGSEGRVEVLTRPLDNGFAVTFKDDGPGIGPDKLERIFDPFFTTREPGQGTGLGLHISRRVALEHSGRLEVASQPGQGACFTLWLPAAT